MRKAILILFLALLAISVSALERTKIYGNIGSNSEISLKLTYTANNIQFINQPASATSDAYGDWLYIINSDSGTITITASSGSVEKEFTATAGQNFEIKLFEDTTTTNATETAENITENNEAQTQEQETPKPSITGKSVFDFSNITNFTASNYKIVLIIIGLFLLFFIANLASHWLMAKFSQSSSTAPNVIKLSDKLAQQQLQQQIEAQRKKEEERKRKIEILKQELNKLEKE